MQVWKSLGRIIDGKDLSGYTHSSVPIVHFRNNKRVRIYFSRRLGNSSLPFYVDFDIERFIVTHKTTEPLLRLGDPGTFDDSGVMPTCTIRRGEELWMYYIGWNLGVTVPFRNSIGLAVSYDNGNTFIRKFDGPILDRNNTEPHFVASCDVMFNEGIYKMWYVCCVGWKYIGKKLRHYYNIKYAESHDGISWFRTGIVSIDFKNQFEFAISAPIVIFDHGIYKMWYSYRSDRLNKGYQIGYAESNDGKVWTRKDELVTFDGHANDWEEEMQCYPSVFDYRGSRYMLYNGNGYGKTGFGLAVLLE